VLLAMSADRLLKPLAFLPRTLPNGEPALVVLVGWTVVQVRCDSVSVTVLTFWRPKAFLFISSPDIISKLAAMVLLATFLVVNLACFTLSVTGAPNWRPLFRMFSWQTCTTGGGRAHGVVTD
jgi:hypothetical protein